MRTEFIVTVPAVPYTLFISSVQGGLHSEYPEAYLFGTLPQAKRSAKSFPGAEVYTTDAYKAGQPSCYTVPA